MLGRIAAVLCWVIGVIVFFKAPPLYHMDGNILAIFYGSTLGVALLGVLLWELGTCAMRLTKIAGKGERKEEKAEPKIKDPTEFSNK